MLFFLQVLQENRQIAISHALEIERRKEVKTCSHTKLR